MKGFASGVGGVCICMLAIMGTILCGFALGGEEHTTTTTRYDYVTDTTGLFDVSEGKKFTTYSPAANWTGFRESSTSETTGGITYQTSSKINSYPISKDLQYLTSKTVNLQSYDLPQADPPGYKGHDVSGLVIYKSQRLDDITSMSDYIRDSRVSTIADFLPKFESTLSGVYAEWSELVIQFQDPESPVVYGACAPLADWYNNWISWTLGGNKEKAAFLPYPTLISCYYVKIDPTYTVTGYDAGGNELWKCPAAAAGLVYGQPEGTSSEYPTTTYTGDVTTIQSSLKVGIYGAPPTEYMDISQGVVPDTDPGAYWSNGYQNGRLDMLIRWNESAESTKTVLWSWLNVDYTIDGVTTTKKISFEVYYEPVAGNNTSLLILGAMQGAGPQYQAEVKAGAFAKGILVSLDMANDQIVVYALGSFSTFEDYALLDTPIATIENFWTDAALLETSPEPGGMTLSSMTLGTTYGKPQQAPTIGIVETSVYMGDKALIMDDATIEPLNLWPGHNDVELRFYSFAVLGDELQIIDDEQDPNTERFAVSDGKIYVQGILPDGKTTVAGWHTLSNLTIRFTWLEKASQWEIWLVFPDEPGQKPIQTGFTDGDSLTIKLAGYWYVQSAFYEGQKVTTTAYDFDFQHFIFDSNAAILAYMGILIMGTIVAKRMGGLGVYDMIVLVFAGTCGFVLMA